MQIVWLTALGVGGATVFGSILGFCFKNISQKFSDAILSFGAGVMLIAAIIGLILPSLELGGALGLPIAAIGIMIGAFCINIADRFVPHLHRIVGISADRRADRVLLFVTAIAIHNLPEGIAAGVGFATGDTANALTVAGGIALQNIPEGMVIISPMLAAGISPARTFICGMFTGVIEIFGTFIGYYAAAFSTSVLPFALAFAGGTMIYVVCDEMIPETHTSSQSSFVTFALLIGVCVMLATSFYL